MAVFTGRRTHRQIIDQALKKVGNTKILVEARVELNRILERLYLEHEWPFLYEEASLTLTSSTALPTDFLKVESPDTGLRGTAVNGVTEDWPILIVTPTAWRRQAIPRAETATHPDIAMIDYAEGVLKPWPIPESTVTALLVYKKLPAESDPTDTTTFDAATPTFPYAGLLSDLLEQWGHEYEHNSQAAQLLAAKNARSLSMILGIANPPDTNQADTIELDAGIFATPLAPHDV